MNPKPKAKPKAKKSKAKAKPMDIYNKILTKGQTGACLFPPKVLERMSKCKDPNIRRAVSDIQMDGPENYSRIFKDLMALFNLGLRPVNRYKQQFVVSTKPMFDRWVSIKSAKGISVRRFPVGDDHVNTMLPYLEDRQDWGSSWLHSAISDDRHISNLMRGLSAGLTGEHKNAEDDLIVSVANYLTKIKHRTKGHIFMTGKSGAAHIERIMKKRNIKRVMCIVSRALFHKEDAITVVPYDRNGKVVSGEYYVSSGYIGSLVRVAQFNRLDGFVPLEKNGQLHVMHPDAYKQLAFDISHGNEDSKLILMSLSNTVWAVPRGTVADGYFTRNQNGILLLRREAPLLNYSTQTNPVAGFDSSHKFYCGFEVEVSSPYDVNIAPRSKKGGQPMTPDELFRKTGWAPTIDRSVEPGFELKSPIISFNTPADIRSKLPPEIGELINRAVKGDKCGGHVHFSYNKISVSSLFNRVRYWAWLFGLLYTHRMTNRYCELTNLKPGDDKYQWLRARDGRIEVRIFPAFKNVNTLAWRAGLLAKMVENNVGSVAGTIAAWENNVNDIVSHVTSVKTAPALLSTLRSTAVQNHLIHFIGLDGATLKAIDKAIESTSDPE